MRNYQRKQADRKADIVTARTRGIGSHKSRGRRGDDDGEAETGTLADDPRQLYTLAIVIRNAIVIALCACLAFPAAELIQLIVPGEYASVLPFACVLIVIDVLLMSPKLSKLTLFSKDWFLFNGSRWVFIVVVFKLLTYLGRSDGLSAIWADLITLRRDPFVYLFTPPFLLSMVVGLIVWSASRILGGDLASLTQGEQELEEQSEAGVRTDRGALRLTLSTHVFAFGILTTVLIGGCILFARLMQRGPVNVPLLTADLLLYFALGLALIGHSQLTMLRANWLWERTPIARNLVKRWTVYGLAFLVGLILLSLVMPTGNVDGMVPALNYLIAALFYVVQLVAFLFIGLLQLLLSPLFALLGQQAPPPAAPPPAPEPMQPVTPDAPMVTPPWVDLVQTILFFTILAIVLIYVLRYLILQHTGLRAALQKLPLLLWLRTAWLGLKRLLRAGQQDLRTLLQSDSQGASPTSANTAGTSSTTAASAYLQPRQQITKLYLDTLDQARDKGIPRRPAQTPDEFAQHLSQRLRETQPDVSADPSSDATPDVNDLTQQFIDARYSRHDVAEENVSRVSRYAQRVRQALSQIRPTRPSRKPKA